MNYFDNYFGNCIKSIDAEGYITTYEYENNLLKNTTYEVDYQVLENGKVVTNKTTKSEKATYDSDEKVTEEREVGEKLLSRIEEKHKKGITTARLCLTAFLFVHFMILLVLIFGKINITHLNAQTFIYLVFKVFYNVLSCSCLK